MGYVTRGNGGTKEFRELSLGEILGFVATALEFGSPPGKGAGVRIARVSLEKLAATIGVEQAPGVGGSSGERFNGAKAGGGGVCCDDCAP